MFRHPGALEPRAFLEHGTCHRPQILFAAPFPTVLGVLRAEAHEWRADRPELVLRVQLIPEIPPSIRGGHKRQGSGGT
jgi:hypothetical protein